MSENKNFFIYAAFQTKTNLYGRVIKMDILVASILTFFHYRRVDHVMSAHEISVINYHTLFREISQNQGKRGYIIQKSKFGQGSNEVEILL